MTDSDWFVKSGVTDAQAADIVETGNDLWNRAEPGFFELATHEYLAGRFEEMGFAVNRFDGIPGFIAESPGSLKTASRVALIADMDALPIPGDAEGSYIHSCGHHMQMANLYGAARILSDSKSQALNSLAFIAAPAEEYIDFQRREPLREKGVVSHLSGKQELLSRGIFAPFEKVVSTHGAGFTDQTYIGSVRKMSGFEVLGFRFHGRAAHAGAAPHKGVNAQNAAALFLQACAFLRESFHESEHIRIHPVMSLSPGQSVNIVPEFAGVETYVRAASPDAIRLTTAKLKAAAEGCARAVGATVDIEQTPGYAPFQVDLAMHEALGDTVRNLGIRFIDEDHGAASSDMGDVSQVVPSVMLGLPGANGLFHNPDFRILDSKVAFVLPSAVVARYLEKLVTG